MDRTPSPVRPSAQREIGDIQRPLPAQAGVDRRQWREWTLMTTRRPGRVKRSAGTMTPLDVLRNLFRPPTRAAIAADLAAIDRGEGRRVACLFRGDYNSYPKRFHRKMADLLPEALVLRPFWSSPDRRSFSVDELVVSADLRRRAPKTDWNILGTGVYAKGQVFDFAGFEVVECQTQRGAFELAVPRPDVSLVLHYLQTARSYLAT